MCVCSVIAGSKLGDQRAAVTRHTLGIYEQRRAAVALVVISLRVTSLWSPGFHSVCVCFTFQLQHEKAELEQHLEQEQEFQVNKLMKKIKKLENDTISKQLTLEQVSIESSRQTFPPSRHPLFFQA